MAAYLDWLPDVLRSAGVDVHVLPGAERRSTRAAGLTVLGVVWHHTATGPAWADGHVAALLRDGRRDLPGPLAQVGIERDGTWVIVALGRANHNGYGTWGNDAIGLEFYNSGLGEPWPDAQVRSGEVGTAAILRHLDMRVTRCRAHRETDPKRKPDPTGLDMHAVRQHVDALLHDDAPPAAPAPEDDMFNPDTDLFAVVRTAYLRIAERPASDAEAGAWAWELGVGQGATYNNLVCGLFYERSVRENQRLLHMESRITGVENPDLLTEKQILETVAAALLAGAEAGTKG